MNHIVVKKHLKNLVILITAFILGFITNWLFFKNTDNQKLKVVREPNSTYEFTSPILFIETNENTSLPYRNLKQTLTNYVNKIISSNNSVSDISVYYRDLKNSNWTGVNSDEKFSPASMLKVATMISILKYAESNPGLLSKLITIKSLPKDSGIQDYYPPSSPIKAGSTYTIQELLTRMIVDSDNTAALALQSIIKPEETKQIYDDLKVPMPTNADDSITSQEYSHFFRVLFSGTYLEHSTSNQVLQMLSETKFDKGLVAGVPTSTLVSHKFGERTFSNQIVEASSTTTVVVANELHDCGIIYYPEHPYFLCVMTKGKGFPELANTIKDVSTFVWNKIPSLF